MATKDGYVLNLYYKDIRSNVSRIETVKKVIKGEAGNDWRVLAYGEHICTIGFFSTLNSEAFSREMKAVVDEDFCFLLIRAAAIPAYNLYGEGAGWFRDTLTRLTIAR